MQWSRKDPKFAPFRFISYGFWDNGKFILTNQKTAKLKISKFVILHAVRARPFNIQGEGRVFTSELFIFLCSATNQIIFFCFATNQIIFFALRAIVKSFSYLVYVNIGHIVNNLFFSLNIKNILFFSLKIQIILFFSLKMKTNLFIFKITLPPPGY